MYFLNIYARVIWIAPEVLYTYCVSLQFHVKCVFIQFEKDVLPQLRGLVESIEGTQRFLQITISFIERFHWNKYTCCIQYVRYEYATLWIGNKVLIIINCY